MEHFYFFLLNFFIFLIIVLVDKKKWKDYILLGLLALLFDAIFEIIPIATGIWVYNSQPKIFGMSLYTWLLYVPYLSMCYFISNKVIRHV